MRFISVLALMACVCASATEDLAQIQHREISDAKKLAAQIQSHLCHSKPAMEAASECAECSKPKSPGPDEVKKQTETLKEALDQQTSRDLAFFEFLKSAKQIGFAFESKEEYENQIKAAEEERGTFEDYEATLIPEDSTMASMIAAMRSALDGAAGESKRELSEKLLDIADKQLAFWEKHTEITDWDRPELVQNSDFKKLPSSLRDWLKTHVSLSGFPERMRVLQWLKYEAGHRAEIDDKLQRQSVRIKIANGRIETLEKHFKSLNTSADEATKPKDDSARERLRAFEASAFLPIQRIEQISGYQACDLSPGEQLAISVYTGSGYGFLNQSLWAGGKEAEDVKPYRDELNAALKKLNPFHGYVQRSVDLTPQLAAEYEPGKTVTSAAFTSTSLYKVFGGRRYHLQILSKSGRLVNGFSKYSGELEVLFPSDRKFKVLSRTKNSFGMQDIVMEEVDP